MVLIQKERVKITYTLGANVVYLVGDSILKPSKIVQLSTFAIFTDDFVNIWRVELDRSDKLGWHSLVLTLFGRRKHGRLNIKYLGLTRFGCFWKVRENGRQRCRGWCKQPRQITLGTLRHSYCLHFAGSVQLNGRLSWSRKARSENQVAVASIGRAPERSPTTTIYVYFPTILYYVTSTRILQQPAIRSIVLLTVLHGL